MEKCDKLTQKQISELRDFASNSKSSGRKVRQAQAIMLLNESIAIKAITSQTFYSRRQIFDLRKSYLGKGITSVQGKKKGKPKELLNKKQLSEIVKIIKKTPKDYGYGTDYWTTGILGAIENISHSA